MADNRINIVISAKDEGTAVVKQFGNSLDDASSKGSAFGASLSRIKDVALGVYLPQLAGKLFDLGKSALDSTGNFEQSRVAFETMLGSAEKAQTMLTQISQFAKETPFDLPGVVDASKQLLAYGFAQDDVLPTMRKLGDVAAGVSVPIGQLTAVYGQVRVAGKLMGQDLLQFTQAGVPLLDYLAQTMHKTAAQIKDDMAAGVGPTFNDVQTALEAMTTSGSKFGGLMAKQSGTFQGVMSNISDSFGQIGRGALGMDTAGNIIKGSFFDRIKDAAAGVMPTLQDFATRVGPMVQQWMDDLIKHVGPVINNIVDFGRKVSEYLGPKLSDLAKTIQDKLIPPLTDLWQNVIVPLIPVIGVTLVAAVGLAVDALNIIVGAVGGLIKGLQDGDPWLWGLITVLTAITAALAFNAAFDAITVGFATFRLITIPSAIASYEAFRGVIAMPLVMPAIAIAAALIAIAQVKKAYDDMQAAIQGSKDAAQNSANTTTKILAHASQIINDGVSSPAQKAAQKHLVNVTAKIDGGREVYPGFAVGTNFAPGGSTLVGEHGPEVVNLPTGSKVTSAWQTASQGSSGGDTYATTISGNIYNQSAEAVDQFFNRIDKTQRLARMGIAG